MDKTKAEKGDRVVMEMANLDPNAIPDRIGKAIKGSGQFDNGLPFSFIAVFKGLAAKGENLEVIIELPSVSDLDGKEKNWTVLNYQDGRWHGSLGPNEGFKVTLDL